MKVVEIRGFGAPEVLVLAERSDPKPGPGEVLVRVSASGVNRPDVLQRKGAYAPPPGASDLPGLEFAGEIIGGDADAMAAGGIQDRRQGVRIGRRRRLRTIRGRAGVAVPAGAQGPERPRSRRPAGDLLHRVDQCVRPRSPAKGRDLARARRHQRHRRHGDSAWQGVRCQGHRHRGQRRQVQGLSGDRRRRGHQLQGAGLRRRGQAPDRRPRCRRGARHGGG